MGRLRFGVASMADQTPPPPSPPPGSPLPPLVTSDERKLLESVFAIRGEMRNELSILVLGCCHLREGDVKQAITVLETISYDPRAKYLLAMGTGPDNYKKMQLLSAAAFGQVAAASFAMGCAYAGLLDTVNMDGFVADLVAEWRQHIESEDWKTEMPFFTELAATDALREQIRTDSQTLMALSAVPSQHNRWMELEVGVRDKISQWNDRIKKLTNMSIAKTDARLSVGKVASAAQPKKAVATRKGKGKRASVVG